jgi:hypothetical protein
MVGPLFVAGNLVLVIIQEPSCLDSTLPVVFVFVRISSPSPGWNIEPYFRRCVFTCTGQTRKVPIATVVVTKKIEDASC